MALFSLVFWFAPAEQAPDLCSKCSRARMPGAAVAGVPDRLRDRGAVSRAVLRRRRLRDVPEPARRARGLGHRAGVPACVRAAERCMPVTVAVRWCSRRCRVAAAPANPTPERPAASGGAGPDRTEITRALETVKADPNLAGERTITMLAVEDSSDAEATGDARVALVDRRALSLARSVGARCLMWPRRWCSRHCWPSTSSARRPCPSAAARARTRSSPRRTSAISTSGPRACPADIGSAARLLWDRGEQRAALALLYRGTAVAAGARAPRADPRFQHRGRLPGARREPSPAEDGATTPRVWSTSWQRFVYGGQDTQAATVHALCDDFASALDPAAPLDVRREGRRMTRAVIWRASPSSLLVALVVWIARNTYWVDMKVPMPPKGEALTNPFYAAQRFAEALGARHDVGSRARRRRHRSGHRAVRVALGPERRPRRGARAVGRIRRPAGRRRDAGGQHRRIRALVGHRPRVPTTGRRTTSLTKKHDEARDECAASSRRKHGAAAGGHAAYCDVRPRPLVVAHEHQAAEWALRDETGIQAMRVARRARQRHGDQRGAVPRAEPVRRRSRRAVRRRHPAAARRRGALPVGGRSPVAAGAARGTTAHPRWRSRWRSSRCCSGAAASASGRSRPRPSRAPLAGRADPRHGTVRAAARRRGPLHAAAVRALERSGPRRIPGYAQLSRPQERAAALGALTGIDGDALAAAIHHGDAARDTSCASTIALLEAARRQLCSSTRGPRMEQS